MYCPLHQFNQLQDFSVKLTCNKSKATIELWLVLAAKVVGIYGWSLNCSFLRLILVLPWKLKLVHKLLFTCWLTPSFLTVFFGSIIVNCSYSWHRSVSHLVVRHSSHDKKWIILRTPLLNQKKKIKTTNYSTTILP